MRIFNKFRGTRGFITVYNDAIRYRYMITEKAMLKAKGTVFVYHPCFFTEMEQVEVYYKELAQKIHEAIQEIDIKQ